MKIELSDEEQHVADKIFEELIGFTIEQAKMILRVVKSDLEKFTVIRGEDNG